MKSLAIHPDDRSTDVLRDIYADVPDCTVITGHNNKKRLIEMVYDHDFIFMLGHGCPHGLFGMGLFPGSYAIDKDFVPALREKKQNICVAWCNADVFFDTHKLAGFYTGMIISELIEAMYFNLRPTEEEVNSSNTRFASSIKKHLFKTPSEMAKAVVQDYGISDDVVTLFNRKNIYGRDG